MTTLTLAELTARDLAYAAEGDYDVTTDHDGNIILEREDGQCFAYALEYATNGDTDEQVVDGWIYSTYESRQGLSLMECMGTDGDAFESDADIQCAVDIITAWATA